MKIQDKIREDMLLLATVTLNFVTELPEYQQFLEDLKSKDIKFEKGKKEYFISKKTFLSEATVQNVLYGSAKITAQTLLTDVLDHLPLVEKIFESEKNLSIFIKLTNRLEGFEYIEKRDEWDLLDELLVSSRKNHGFDDYL